MQTYIIVSNVDEGPDRQSLEMIENQQFKDIFELAKELGTNEGYEVYTLSDFMTACNDDEVTNSEHWIGYVQLAN